jgi:hypothetical protein
LDNSNKQKKNQTHLDHFPIGCLNFLHQFGSAQSFRCEMVDGGDRTAAQYFRVEFDVVTLDVLDDHDFHFGEEVQGHLVDGIADLIWVGTLDGDTMFDDDLPKNGLLD